MGGTSSKSTGPLTQEQQDVRALAEKFAFGDDELWHIYRAYHRVQNLHSSSSTTTSENWRSSSLSFLRDWGLACSDLDNTPGAEESAAKTQSKDRCCVGQDEDPPTEAQVDRMERLKQVDAMLGDFGNRLYATAFLAAGDTSMYTYERKTFGSSAAGAIPCPTIADEYTRRTRLEAIFEGLARCSRRGSQSTLTVLFRTLENEHHLVCPLELVTLGYNLALATAVLQVQLDVAPPPNSATLHAFARSLQDRALSCRQRYGSSSAATNDKVELTELLEWADVSCPVFSSLLPSFLWHVFFPNRPSPPSRTAFEFPRLLMPQNNGDSSHDGEDADPQKKSDVPRDDGSALLSPSERYILACCSISLNGPYFPLFNSEQDGLSFNRLQNALLGYDGPTLMVIRTGSATLGAFTASKWKECRDFYGTAETFLWTLSPQIRVYRPTLRESHYQYCNSSARSKGFDQQAHGLGFGGNSQRPRLFLSETLDDCHADRQDLTFDNGALLLGSSSTDPNGSSSGVPGGGGDAASTSFSPDTLQVWAVGGEEVVQAALEARGHHRDTVEQGIRRARKVDKAQFLDDLRSGAIDSKAFAYRQQIDGRADQDVKERNQEQQRKHQQQQRW